MREQVERARADGARPAEGNFESISLDELRELRGRGGRRVDRDPARPARAARAAPATCARASGGLELTPRAIRRIGAHALDDSLRRAEARRRRARTRPQQRGGGRVPIETRKPYVFGEPAHIDAVATVRNALLRDPAHAGVPVAVMPQDLEVWETDQQTETTTVLLLDMSWSMSWSGRFPAAKRVAIAMDQLIRTRFPRDHFFVVGFSTRARELRIRELPELVWNMGDPFTNLQDGLCVARAPDRPAPESASTQIS